MTLKSRRRYWLAGGVLALLVAALAVYWLAPGTLYQAVIGLERWRAGLEQRSVVVDGRQWSYLVGGQGPPLMLLHGFGANKDNWNRLAPFLVEHYRIIAPDLIGFGDSDAPRDVSYGIDQQADRALALADALALDRLHLGGSSMGGYIAAVMAAKAPDRIESLLLLAPGGVAGAPPSEMFRLIEQAGDNPLVPESPEDFEQTLEFVFHEQPFLPRPIVEHLAREMAAREPMLEQIFDDLRYRSAPLEQYVDRITAPALIIWGAHDRVLHPAGGAVLDREIASSTLVQLPDAGHLPMIEDPGRVAASYLEWQAAR